MAEAIASGWVSQGPRVRAFEEAFAARVGAADAVATTNCTTALQLALYASGVGPGDEVIVPSLSFIATANAVWQNGATPVFADVDPLTGNIDATTVERVITDRTKAIMPVHQLGLPADMDPLMELAQRRGLAVVEDAACAIGARYRSRPIGSLGPLACFSLHPRKVITTGEGGMIAVEDPAVADAPAQTAPARHGRLRYRPPRRARHCHRGLSGARLERAHDRHAGGARAHPARAARRDPGGATAPGRALHRRVRADARTSRLRTSPSTRSARGSPTRCTFRARRPDGPDRADASSPRTTASRLGAA